MSMEGRAPDGDEGVGVGPIDTGSVTRNNRHNAFPRTYVRPGGRYENTGLT